MGTLYLSGLLHDKRQEQFRSTDEKKLTADERGMVLLRLVCDRFVTNKSMALRNAPTKNHSSVFPCSAVSFLGQRYARRRPSSRVAFTASLGDPPQSLPHARRI